MSSPAARPTSKLSSCFVGCFAIIFCCVFRSVFHWKQPSMYVVRHGSQPGIVYRLFVVDRRHALFDMPHDRPDGILVSLFPPMVWNVCRSA